MVSVWSTEVGFPWSEVRICDVVHEQVYCTVLQYSTVQYNGIFHIAGNTFWEIRIISHIIAIMLHIYFVYIHIRPLYIHITTSIYAHPSTQDSHHTTPPPTTTPGLPNKRVIPLNRHHNSSKNCHIYLLPTDPSRVPYLTMRTYIRTTTSLLPRRSVCCM